MTNLNTQRFDAQIMREIKQSVLVIIFWLENEKKNPWIVVSRFSFGIRHNVLMYIQLIGDKKENHLKESSFSWFIKQQFNMIS
jgi:hypothetical protein